MLEVRDTLNNCEPYYILNNLYITDYAVWLQKARCGNVSLVVLVSLLTFSLQCETDTEGSR